MYRAQWVPLDYLLSGCLESEDRRLKTPWKRRPHRKRRPRKRRPPRKRRFPLKKDQSQRSGNVETNLNFMEVAVKSLARVLQKLRPSKNEDVRSRTPIKTASQISTEYAKKIRLNHFVRCAPHWALFATTFSAFEGPALLCFPMRTLHTWIVATRCYMVFHNIYFQDNNPFKMQQLELLHVLGNSIILPLCLRSYTGYLSAIV